MDTFWCTYGKSSKLDVAALRRDDVSGDQGQSFRLLTFVLLSLCSSITLPQCSLVMPSMAAWKNALGLHVGLGLFPLPLGVSQALLFANSFSKTRGNYRRFGHHRKRTNLSSLHERTQLDASILNVYLWILFLRQEHCVCL